MVAGKSDSDSDDLPDLVDVDEDVESSSREDCSDIPPLVDVDDLEVDSLGDWDDEDGDNEDDDIPNLVALASDESQGYGSNEDASDASAPDSSYPYGRCSFCTASVSWTILPLARS